MAMPGKDWKERIEPGEEERLEAHAQALRAMQRKQARGGRADRALHAKANAGAIGELEVLPDLPEHARAGLFASPATYRAYVRFSNGSGVRQGDKKGDVRGFAVKVVGVEGKKVIPGMESAKTQDFLFIRTPTIPFRDAHEFVGVVTAAASPALLLPRAVARLGVRRALELLPALAKGLNAAMAPLADTTWYTAAPIRYGEYAAKAALFPRDQDPPPAGPHGPDWLGETLAARLREGDVAWDLRVQLYADEGTTPIEDPSVEWTEAHAPFVTVARLTLRRQDLASDRSRKIAAYVETLSFDPWHALESHRPLGGIMRARNHAYRLSTQERGAAAEPDGTETHD